jgi:hypothetical protein
MAAFGRRSLERLSGAIMRAHDQGAIIAGLVFDQVRSVLQGTNADLAQHEVVGVLEASLEVTASRPRQCQADGLSVAEARTRESDRLRACKQLSFGAAVLAQDVFTFCPEFCHAGNSLPLVEDPADFLPLFLRLFILLLIDHFVKASRGVQHPPDRLPLLMSLGAFFRLRCAFLEPHTDAQTFRPRLRALHRGRQRSRSFGDVRNGRAEGVGGRRERVHVPTHASDGAGGREQLGVVVVDERLAIAVEVPNLCQSSVGYYEDSNKLRT